MKRFSATQDDDREDQEQRARSSFRTIIFKRQMPFCPCKLRVTDENTRSDQPYETSSRRWKLAFNGEIYNYKDLDEQLKKTGWRAKSSGDTERLAEIREHCGAESLHRLDGMFAIAAFDEKTNCLLIARDRFGQKPLYYVDNEEIFAFASELKALLPLSSTIKMKIDIEAMSQYFRLRYIHAPQTCINPIKIRTGTVCNYRHERENIFR